MSASSIGKLNWAAIVESMLSFQSKHALITCHIRAGVAVSRHAMDAHRSADAKTVVTLMVSSLVQSL